jgi:hypothetical protein
MSIAALLAAGVLSFLKVKPDRTETDVAPTATTSMGGAAAAS